MLKNLKKLIKDEEGATAVEYGLIVGPSLASSSSWSSYSATR